MQNLRRKWNRFLYNNSGKGIPNLMAIITIGTLFVYFLSSIDPSKKLLYFISFQRDLILHGQIWRLLTFIFVPQRQSVLLLVLLLVSYFFMGRTIESVWGTLKFNLFYFCGVFFTALGGMLFGYADVFYLNLSLFLAVATLMPEGRVLVMYIIPMKMKYLAWFYLAIVLYNLLNLNFLPLIALLNYFLFFGKDCLSVLPGSFGSTSHHSARRKYTGDNRPNPNWASAYKNSSEPSKKAEYRHKCCVCGKTDVSHPNLEFRYCSKCAGYYCYCEEHINNHSHIQ